MHIYIKTMHTYHHFIPASPSFLRCSFFCNSSNLMATGILTLALSVIVFSALAAAETSLQDFCVADPTSQVLVNGFTCKDPRKVTADDFFFTGLDIANDTSNALGSNVTPVTVFEMPGLYTLGLTLVRIDYAPGGIIRPHIHPRSSEILTVMEGSLQVGFITSNPENRHMWKVLNKGDVMALPQGLIHYQRNVGKEKVVAYVALNSENPGVINVGNAVFGAKPEIDDGVLTKAFQLDKNIVNSLQAKFK